MGPVQLTPGPDVLGVLDLRGEVPEAKMCACMCVCGGGSSPPSKSPCFGPQIFRWEDLTVTMEETMAFVNHCTSVVITKHVDQQGALYIFFQL